MQVEGEDVGDGVGGFDVDHFRVVADSLTGEPAAAAVEDLAVEEVDGVAQAVLLDVVGEFFDVFVVEVSLILPPCIDCISVFPLRSPRWLTWPSHRLSPESAVLQHSSLHDLASMDLADA